MLNVWVDEFTPCLKDNYTGALIETEVMRIKNKSFLSKFNKKNGWYVNWGNLVNEHEIYALVTKGNTDIQGLVALQKSDDLQAVYVAWMCVSPYNNPQIAHPVRYAGVGGHLFAIATNSMQNTSECYTNTRY